MISTVLEDSYKNITSHLEMAMSQINGEEIEKERKPKGV